VGEKPFLESNTPTPILKKLESLGNIYRQRDRADERQVSVRLPLAGDDLLATDDSSGLIKATGLGEEFPAVQRTVAPLRDKLLQASQSPK